MLRYKNIFKSVKLQNVKLLLTKNNNIDDLAKFN